MRDGETRLRQAYVAACVLGKSIA